MRIRGSREGYVVICEIRIRAAHCPKGGRGGAGRAVRVPEHHRPMNRDFPFAPGGVRHGVMHGASKLPFLFAGEVDSSEEFAQFFVNDRGECDILSCDGVGLGLIAVELWCKSLVARTRQVFHHFFDSLRHIPVEH